MIQISDHFTYRRLLRFTFPSIVMMVFTSIYSVVDGLFVSNFTGKTAFAAVNFIFPFLTILAGVGFMFGNGGSALVAKTLGEQRGQKANEIFTSLVRASLATGAALALVGVIILRPVASLMGAKGLLLEECLIYGRIYLIGLPAIVVQYEFQNLYTTAGKPKLGLYTTVASGISNIVLDALFVAVLDWGLSGAAAATVLSQYLGGIFPLIYFSRKNSSLLRFVRAKFDWWALGRICTNGASELLNNVSMAIVGMLYNIQLLNYAGDDGLAAYGVLMYIDFLFISIFIGYVVGVCPVISYHFGAQNHKEIRSLIVKSFTLLGICQILMFVIAEVSARPVSRLFVGYDPELLRMTLRGFFLFSFCFLGTGFSIFGSSFFTALNNGLISAFISFMRTIVFQVGAVVLLPLVWDLDGIWISTAVSDFASAALGIWLILLMRKKYHY